MPTDKKCAIVAVIGAPNAGKSTIINKLVGSKVSIVTPKPQTTRNCIRGIGIYEKTQIVFVDTPGIFSSAKSDKAQRSMHQTMVRSAWGTAKDADFSLFILDSKKGLKENEQQIVEEIKKRKIKTALVLNKIDLLLPEELLILAKKLNEIYAFDATFMVSAAKGSGIKELKSYLTKNATVQEWIYPEDEITDAPSRFLAEEITREKILLATEQEIPHFTKVETEKWEEKKDALTIHQAIIVAREAHKKIIIGDKGSKIKEIGQKARIEMAKAFGLKVNLYLFVKIKPDWMDRFGA